MGKVYIILLNWNGHLDTIQCIRSLLRLTYSDLNIVVVDNGSNPDSFLLISKAFPTIKIIYNALNLGFAGGNNVGIKYALSEGAEYVWILNNDTIVSRHSLSRLMESINRDSQIGLISPAIYNYEQPRSIQFMGSIAYFSKFVIRNIEDRNMVPLYNRGGQVILWGTALLVRKEVFEQIGFLTEKYFAYIEDCDFCFRAIKAGFTTKLELNAKVFHKGARSTGLHSPTHIYLGMRNDYFLWKDHSSWYEKLYLPFPFLAKAINYCKGLIDEGNQQGYHACIAGVHAAFKGVEGNFDDTVRAPQYLLRLFSFFLSWHPYVWVHLLRGEFRILFKKVVTGSLVIIKNNEKN